MIKKYFLLFIFFIILATVSQGALPNYRLIIRISNDSGTTQFDPDFGNNYNTWSCTGGFCSAFGEPDITNQYGNGASGDLWEKTSWSLEELNETNFLVNLTVSSISGSTGNPAVDSVALVIYYTVPEFDVNFSSPTPENNSYIGGTLHVNATTGELVSSCKLQHNISGELENVTLDVTDDYNCGGYVYKIYNTTVSPRNIRYNVIADGFDVDNQYSEENINIVNNTIPDFNTLFPVNNTRSILKSQLFSWTYEDPYYDYYDVFFKLSPNISKINSSVSFANGTQQGNGSSVIRYDVSHYPQEGLKALWHFDNDGLDNTTHYYDVINNTYAVARSDGEMPYMKTKGGGKVTYTGGQTYGYPSRYGVFFPAETTAVNSTLIVNQSDRYNTLCHEGCTIGAWVYIEDFIESTAFISREQWSISPNEAYFSLSSSSQGTGSFNIYEGSGLTPRCFAQSAGNGIKEQKWNHVVGVYSLNDSDFGGANVTKFYLNGQYNNAGACGTFHINKAEWENADIPILFGERVNGLFNNPLYGILDEVFFYDRPLSTGEISNLHNLTYDRYYWQACVNDGNEVCTSINQRDLDTCECPKTEECYINTTTCNMVFHPINAGGYGIHLVENITTYFMARLFNTTSLAFGNANAVLRSGYGQTRYE